MSKRERAKPQRSKRARRTEAPNLFSKVADCPATREAIGAYGRDCPLCFKPAGDHLPEAADVVRDDRGDFAAWMLSLPRNP